ncbi:MAG: hypothetical protein H6R15_3990 [Proteobacteria bacterium]|nr:hypothetical protein [Pseudomonadota bacterium]
MARELITSWGDYQTAIDRLLAIAVRKIAIYDEDLGHLHLDSAPRLGQVKRLLHGESSNLAVRIAIRNADPLRQRQPLLMNLLTTFSHCLTARQTPPQLAHLRDTIILVDDQHGLIRFERDQARSKLLLDEANELKPYLNRFEEIWSESSETVNSTTLGL